MTSSSEDTDVMLEPPKTSVDKSLADCRSDINRLEKEIESLREQDPEFRDTSIQEKIRKKKGCSSCYYDRLDTLTQQQTQERNEIITKVKTRKAKKKQKAQERNEAYVSKRYM